MLNKTHYSNKKNMRKLRNQSKEYTKIYDVLKKLQHVFAEDSHLMLQCSEYLIKENTLCKTPIPSNVCNWVQQRTNVFITLTDARCLLKYVAIQLAKKPNIRNCALLPPRKSEYDKWYQDLMDISKKTCGGNTYDNEGESNVKIFSVEDYKLKKKRNRNQTTLTKKLKNSEDPTLHMFPSIPSAQPKSILKPSSNSENDDSSPDKSIMTPIKFKKSSNSMSYNRYNSFADTIQSKPISVSEMVALARKKQHFERLQRAYEEELSSGKRDIDTSLADKKTCSISRGLPKLKDIGFNDIVDKKLFGENGVNRQTLNEFGVYSDVSSKLTKSRPRFEQESKSVKNEVYSILGVRPDKTVRYRKY